MKTKSVKLGVIAAVLLSMAIPFKVNAQDKVEASVGIRPHTGLFDRRLQCIGNGLLVQHSHLHTPKGKSYIV